MNSYKLLRKYDKSIGQYEQRNQELTRVLCRMGAAAEAKTIIKEIYKVDAALLKVNKALWDQWLRENGVPNGLRGK